MLEIIKQCISDAKSDTLSFEDYYHRYVMEMQDISIDREVKYLFNHNIIDSIILDRQILLELGDDYVK